MSPGRLPHSEHWGRWLGRGVDDPLPEVILPGSPDFTRAPVGLRGRPCDAPGMAPQAVAPQAVCDTKT